MDLYTPFFNLFDFFDSIVDKIIASIDDSGNFTLYFIQLFREIFNYIYNLFSKVPLNNQEFTKNFPELFSSVSLGFFITLTIFIISINLMIKIFKIVINAFSYLFNGKEAYNEENIINSFESSSMDSTKSKKLVSKKRKNRR